MESREWQLVLEPEGKNEDEKNKGGIVVYLDDGHRKQEVGRVGFVRENTLHPEIEFEAQLKTVVAKARAAVAAIEELLSGAGELA